MTYQIKLIEADIRNPMDGNMLLGLEFDGKLVAKLEYFWDEKKFSSVFHGNAPSLPVAAHPMTLLQKPIAALYAAKTEKHAIITDVFQDHKISIQL